MKYVRSLGLVLVALAVLVGCGGPTTTGQQANGTTKSEQNISAQNRGTVAGQLRFTAKTIEGKDFSGQSLAGKPAVLWFGCRGVRCVNARRRPWPRPPKPTPR